MILDLEPGPKGSGERQGLIDRHVQGISRVPGCIKGPADLALVFASDLVDKPVWPELGKKLFPGQDRRAESHVGDEPGFIFFIECQAIFPGRRKLVSVIKRDGAEGQTEASEGTSGGFARVISEADIEGGGKLIGARPADKECRAPAQGDGKSRFVVPSREIHPLDFAFQRNPLRGEVGQDQAEHGQVPEVLCLPDVASQAKSQGDSFIAESDDAQNLVDVEDDGIIPGCFVAAQVPEAGLQAPFFSESELRPCIQPEIQGSPQAAVHPLVVHQTRVPS